MHTVRRLLALILSALALSAQGSVMPGLLLASLALAAAIGPRRTQHWIDVTLLVWSSLVLLTFTGVRFETWLVALQPLNELRPGVFSSLSLPGS